MKKKKRKENCCKLKYNNEISAQVSYIKFFSDLMSVCLKLINLQVKKYEGQLYVKIYTCL